MLVCSLPTGSVAGLREAVLALQGPLCIMPGCSDPWVDRAHIEPSGMGGRPSLANGENLVGLCRYHHDIFDGRSMAGRQRMLRVLMRSHADRIRALRVSEHPELLGDGTAG